MLPYSTPNHDFAFEQSVIGMALVSLDGTILKVNSALCDLLGCSPQELTAGAPQEENSLRELLNRVIQNARAAQGHQPSIPRLNMLTVIRLIASYTLVHAAALITIRSGGPRDTWYNSRIERC